MNRHQATSEKRCMVLHFGSNPITDLTKDSLRLIYGKPSGPLSKWFDESAWRDYQKAIQAQLHSVKKLISDDPHSRRLVMYGPLSACWLSTQWLSLTNGADIRWHVIATYRSMDVEHVEVDKALQLTLTNELISNCKIDQLTMFIGSYHHYLKSPPRCYPQDCDPDCPGPSH